MIKKHQLGFYSGFSLGFKLVSQYSALDETKKKARNAVKAALLKNVWESQC